MVKTLDIEAILTRRQQIAAEIERLRTEDNELEIAVRVAQRFSGGSTTGNGAEIKLGPPRPENTPPLFEMTESVLRSAIDAGKTGLKGKEIVVAIGKAYWPGVRAGQILPPIYGFAKKGRLDKNKDGVFRPVQK
jgi:hypothetical protein